MTHSLVEMLQEATKQVPALADLLDEARKLDLHYIPARYPNGLPSGYPHEFYSKRMAGETLDAAEKVWRSIEGYYKDRGEENILPSSPS